MPSVPAGVEAKPWARKRSDEPVPEPSEAELMERGLEAFRTACSDSRGDLHVVPLSGGLDSRLILGVLLQMGLGERLVAVTFGTPGTLDFELGREVARFAGVRHETIDLTRVEIGEEALLGAVRSGPNWTLVFEAFYNDLVPRLFGAGAVYWSGLMANTLNGSRYQPERDRSWEEACASFASKNRIVRSIDLCPGLRAESVLPRSPIFPGSRLTFYEQLYLGVKYPGRFSPCVLSPGFEYRLPFQESSWVDFALSLPDRHRRGERFYRRMARHAFPELFRLPTKNQLGLRLGAPAWRTLLARAQSRAGRMVRRVSPRLARGVPRKTNYVDFDGELRRDTPLRGVVRSLLDGLGRRSLIDWVDVEGIWKRHVAWRENHGLALAVLASLEANLRAREARQAGVVAGSAPDR